jgi:hypothetical protein
LRPLPQRVVPSGPQLMPLGALAAEEDLELNTQREAGREGVVDDGHGRALLCEGDAIAPHTQARSGRLRRVGRSYGARRRTSDRGALARSVAHWHRAQDLVAELVVVLRLEDDICEGRLGLRIIEDNQLRPIFGVNGSWLVGAAGRVEPAFEGDGEGVGGGLPSGHPACSAPPGGV